jgi:hypothetical protein
VQDAACVGLPRTEKEKKRPKSWRTKTTYLDKQKIPRDNPTQYGKDQRARMPSE